MGTMDRIKNEAEDLAGKAKETVGKIVGDDEKVAEGRKDQASAGVKNAGEDVKDAASNAKDAAKDALGSCAAGGRARTREPARPRFGTARAGYVRPETSPFRSP
jgi:uncharacterized protein YjbJ (UPF0337 family)